MFRDALIIFKKELKNVFKDARSILFLFFMPLILYPLLIYVIGSIEKAQAESNVQTIYRVEIRNAPDNEFENILNSFLLFEKTPVTIGYSRIEESSNYIIVEFPEDASEKIEARKRFSIDICYLSTSQKSSYAAYAIKRASDRYSAELQKDLLITFDLSLQDLELLEARLQDFAPEEVRGSRALVAMLPFMTLLYAFFGAMGIGMDTTVGEKERDSLAVLLVNQVSRTSIAFGKILYVMTIGLLNSLAVFAGLSVVIISGGNLLGDQANLSGIGFLGIAGLFISLLSVSAIASSLAVLIGSLARTMTESYGFMIPVYAIVMITAVGTISLDPPPDSIYYFIPIVNSIFTMKSLLLAQFVWSKFLYMIITNLFFSAIIITGVARAFKSEKILYRER